MGEDRLDKFMKDKVFDHQTPANIDAMWRGIQAKRGIEEKPKRRWLFWLPFWGGALVLTSLVAYALWSNGVGEKDAVGKNDFFPPTTTLAPASTDSGEMALASTAPTLDLQDPSATTAPAKVNRNAKSNSTSTASTKSNSNSTATTTNTTAIRSTQTVQERLPRNAKATTPPLASDNANLLASPASPPVLNPALKQENKTTAKDVAPIAVVKDNFRNWSTLAILPPSSISLLPTTELPDLSRTALPIIPRLRNSRFSIGVQVDYGFSARQLTSRAGGEDNYLNLRNDLETPQSVFSGGFDLQVQLSPRLFLKGGFAYEQITELFYFNQIGEPETFFNENAPRAINKLADGSTDIIFGTTSTQQKNRLRKIYNRYRSIDLPLLIGFNVAPTKRWSYYAEAGVLLNLAFMPRGEILAADEETIFDLTTSSVLKPNLGLSINAGLGLTYRLDKNWSCYLSPRLRYALSSMTDDSYVLEQSFVRGALQIGIRRAL